jgi:NADH pyrophosphatase NudC (nudix superfamily)
MKYCPKCAKVLVKKEIDNKQRLCCTDKSCGYIFWNNPIPVVAIVVETAQGIVLAHNKMAPKEVFSIITGFLETDETPQSAAQRETKEELGLDFVSTTFLGVFPFPKANQIVIAYHIYAQGDIQLNEELDEFKIIEKKQLFGWSDTGQFEVEKWLNRLNVFA